MARRKYNLSRKLLFYGHGVGVKTKEEIIYSLNERRIPYAFISAYLTDFITRIDSRMMSQYALLTRHKHQ